jgi:hypothetical protein
MYCIDVSLKKKNYDNKILNKNIFVTFELHIVKILYVELYFHERKVADIKLIIDLEGELYSFLL